MASTLNWRQWQDRVATDTFPVTIVMGSQLLAMVVVPALLNHTIGERLMIGICAVATAVAFAVEALTVPLITQPPQKVPHPVSLRAAWAVMLIGILASVGATAGGVGTYATQLGKASQAGYTAFLTPFLLWPMFAVALFVWLFRRQEITRKHALWATAAAMATEAYVGFERAILGEPVAVIFSILVMIVLGRLVQLRVLVAVVALIPLLWPTIYSARDAVRQGVTGGSLAVVSNDSPSERLQLDKQMSLVSVLHNVDLQPPSTGLVVRTGLVPGFLDPGRAPLDTNQMLNVAAGGVDTSSRSATFLGNVYLFNGWIGVAVSGAVLALVVGAAMRRRLHGPWALAVVGVTYLAGISFNASYPNGVALFLQGIETLALAYGLVRFLSRSPAKADAAPRYLSRPSEPQRLG